MARPVVAVAKATTVMVALVAGKIKLALRAMNITRALGAAVAAAVAAVTPAKAVARMLVLMAQGAALAANRRAAGTMAAAAHKGLW
jgi:hypothetical protein